MTTKTSQAEYVTKSELKEELQKMSEYLVSEITNNMTTKIISRIDDLEETTVKGFGKIYDHVYVIENTIPTLATKNVKS